ncbi:MAG: hypothetical protein FWC00_01970 [Firmicutes bacterium]|nr:hypothetical protein [Bacillota bacterium]
MKIARQIIALSAIASVAVGLALIIVGSTIVGMQTSVNAERQLIRGHASESIRAINAVADFNISWIQNDAAAAYRPSGAPAHIGADVEGEYSRANVIAGINEDRQDEIRAIQLGRDAMLRELRRNGLGMGAPAILTSLESLEDTRTIGTGADEVEVVVFEIRNDAFRSDINLQAFSARQNLQVAFMGQQGNGSVAGSALIWGIALTVLGAALCIGLKVVKEEEAPAKK